MLLGNGKYRNFYELVKTKNEAVTVNFYWSTVVNGHVNFLHLCGVIITIMTLTPFEYCIVRGT